MDVIKTCPWCNGSGILREDPLWHNGHGYIGNYNHYVQCSQCGAISPHGKVDDIYRSTDEAIALAIKWWNERGNCLA